MDIAPYIASGDRYLRNQYYFIVSPLQFALLAAGLGAFALRRRSVPDLAERVGVFDETVAGDIFADYNPWEVRR